MKRIGLEKMMVFMIEVDRAMKIAGTYFLSATITTPKLQMKLIKFESGRKHFIRAITSI